MNILYHLISFKKNIRKTTPKLGANIIGRSLKLVSYEVLYMPFSTEMRFHISGTTARASVRGYDYEYRVFATS